MATTSRPPRDPGLQPERTGLAAMRTTMVATIVGLLCLRAWFITHDTASFIAAVAACATAAATLALAVVHARGAPAERKTTPRSVRWSNLVIAAMTAVAAVSEIARLAAGVLR